jgi:GTP-binding protein
VTRDRIASPCSLGPGPDGEERFVELVDTGGIGIVDSDQLSDHVEEQITFALEGADLILFTVDAREGVAALDRAVAQRLRKHSKPVLLVANKLDEPEMDAELSELHSLGFGQPLRFSANAGFGRTDLLERIAEMLHDSGHTPGGSPAEAVMKLAIVGKRNAGKSTFINALAGEERVIVSEVPGTTRDSVDVRVELEGRPFIAIDTAGVRKRRSFEDHLEFYSHHRAMRSIRRADVVALMIDATLPVSQVDKELAGEIFKEMKPVVIVINKWDLAKGQLGEDYQDYLARMFPELSFAPVSLTSAAQGKNIAQTIRLAEQLYDQSRMRLPTADINRAVQEIQQLRGPSHKTGTKPPKILYASQVGTEPPTIVCFVNDVRSFDTGYQRFLINQLRLRLPFHEIPIRLFFNQRKRRGDDEEETTR